MIPSIRIGKRFTIPQGFEPRLVYIVKVSVPVPREQHMLELTKETYRQALCNDHAAYVEIWLEQSPGRAR